MKLSESNLISTKIPQYFPEYVREKYPIFIDFIKQYFSSGETIFGNFDLINNIFSYYNIANVPINKLVNHTKLVADNNTNLVVTSTKGFPESGFIKIGDEYIYYKSKTITTFVDCVRGATAAEIKNGAFAYSSSVYTTHTINDKVLNAAYSFSEHILENFREKYLSNLPKKLNPNVSYKTLISNIKQFYGSVGTEDSIKFLFRIVYNNTSTHLLVNIGGSGAEIEVVIDSGIIISTVIINGGLNYPNNPLYYPELVINGIGVGARLVVTGVTDGVITSVGIESGGTLYNNQTKILVRNRDFEINEIVTGDASKSVGTVTYWNPDTKELYLDHVDGVFSKNEIVSSQTAIGNILDTEIVTNEPKVRLPYENTLKTHSDGDYTLSELLIKLNNDTLLSGNLIFRQNAFGVIKIELPISELNYYDSDVVRVMVDKNDNFYIPPITKVVSLVDDRLIVDSTVGFLSSGIIKIGNECIGYTKKTINEFIGITRTVNNTDLHTIILGDKVSLYGGYNDGQIYNLDCSIVSDNVEVGGVIVGVTNNPVVGFGGSGYVSSTFSGLHQIKYEEPIKKYWGNVLHLYDYINEVYVTSIGKPVPNAFNTNIRTYEEQELIRRIPKNNFTTADDVTKAGIGLTIDGVEICNYSGDVVYHGNITRLSISNFGDGYKIPNNINDVYPFIKINSVNFTNLIKIYGGIKSINLSNIPQNILSNFSRKPKITVSRGVGDNTGIDAELECDYDASGKINGILVKNSGKWYTEIPIVTITEGGKYLTPYIIPPENINVVGYVGKYEYTPTELQQIDFDPKKYTELDIVDNTIYTSVPTVELPIGYGASLGVNIVSGEIISVVVENPGYDYYTSPELILTNTNGVGAKLKANVRYGKIISVDVISGGSGYVNPLILVVPGGTDAKLECEIETWHKNIVFNNPYIDDDGGYVYNLGDPNLSVDNVPQTNQYPQYLQLRYIDRNVYEDIIIDANTNQIVEPYHIQSVNAAEIEQDYLYANVNSISLEYPLVYNDINTNQIEYVIIQNP